MTTLTITAKGQVTLKQELLKHLGVIPGQKVEVDKLPDGGIVVRAGEQKNTVSDFIGCLKQSNGPQLSIEQINDIAAKGWTQDK